MPKAWRLQTAAPQEFREKFPEINPVILQLLYARGLDTQEKIDEFFNPDYEQDIHDPFLFRDMAKACQRIWQAIDQGEKILVHGDYDVDGVTSSAVLMKTLKKLMAKFGAADKIDELLGIYIPHREKEGYGLNLNSAKSFVKDKYNLVITVDCAVSNKAEVEFLQQAGIDVIITDHHQEPPELPQAYALVDPSFVAEKYPFKKLAGVGVAFKVAQALISEAKKRDPKENWEGFEKWLLDLVAIGTVADVAPILGENRTLVKYGLVVLNKTPRVGLQALFYKAGIGGNGGGANGWRDTLPKAGLNTYSIAFQIAPRLNAAGRMDHANTAYGLLLTEDIEAAESLSDQIQQSNVARQSLTEGIIDEIIRGVAEQIKNEEKVIVALGEGWPTGVLGLVAGRLTDRYCRPVVVASLFDGKIVASTRSVDEFNFIAALQKIDRYFSAYGGHPAACGLTLKDNNDFSSFKKEIQALGREELAGIDLTPVLEIDAEIKLEDASWALYDELEKLEPFGEENPKPVFAAYGVVVDSVAPLGKDGKHLKIMVRQQNGLVRKLIGFGLAGDFGQLTPGDKIDVVLDIGINEWNGNRELQLKIIDLKNA